LLLVTSVPN